MAETAAMNGAEWLARALAGTGMTPCLLCRVDDAPDPAGSWSDLGVKPILAHSEKAAAYMADGYARVAARPGVCMAQSVGAANLASGLQDPYLGRSPVIALTGRKEPSFQHRNSYQEIAHAPLFAAVTKFSTPVDSTSELPRLLRHAWRAALADTVAADASRFQRAAGRRHRARPDRRAADDRARARRQIPVHRPVADDRDIERAATAAGRRPPPRDRRRRRRRGVRARARRFWRWPRRCAAPVATTLGARGIIPTRHRLSVGVAGSYSAPPANRIVHSADLVLFIGCDTGDQVTLNWTHPAARHQDRADRRRSARNRPLLSEHDRASSATRRRQWRG